MSNETSVSLAGSRAEPPAPGEQAVPGERRRGASEPLFSRRAFLSGVAAAGVAASALGLPTHREARRVEAADIGPTTGAERADHALEIRLRAARLEREQPLPDHPDNGDEARYPNRIGSYSKALPHNELDEVDPAAYDSLIRALMSGDPETFAEIPLGGTLKLVDPQASLAYSLLGPDSHQLAIPPAPAFSSAHQAAEMAELYWAALARDVPFSQYETSPLIQQAASDLSQFSDFRGPKVGGEVTPQVLFRGDLPGDLVGPFVSQFLLADVPYGTRPLDQRIRTAAPGVDFLTAYDDWLAVQNGGVPLAPAVFDPTLRYVRSGRDLAKWVHRDFPFQSGLNAALILFGVGSSAAPDGDVLPGSLVFPAGGAPLDPSNPYASSRTEVGFATFGISDYLDLVAVVANRALVAAWYQKWLVHRRLRPEEFAGRIHNVMTGRTDYPINEEIRRSAALGLVAERHGSFLLPQAYPEGAPTHPAYPSGHAAFVGACCTVLKAIFDESFVIPNPVVAGDDGLSLRPAGGPALTVGGELNKLASNISFGRAFAGIHYRSCADAGLRLGEAVAIGVLAEKRLTYNQRFPGFTLTRFDGSSYTVTAPVGVANSPASLAAAVTGSAAPLGIDARMSAEGETTLVDVSITNNSGGGIAQLEVCGVVPAGARLVAASPMPFETRGGEVVWFNGAGLGQGQTLSGFQFRFSGGTSSPVVSVSFIGKTRGTVSTAPAAARAIA